MKDLETRLWHVTERLAQAVRDNQKLRDEHQQTERREGQERYKSLFHQNPEPVFELDLDGYIVAANESVQSILGYQEAEVRGRHYSDFLAEDVQGIEKERYRRNLLAGEAFQFETTLLAKGGSLLYVSMKKVPIVLNGAVVGAYSICTDITVRRQMEKLLQENEERYLRLQESLDRFSQEMLGIKTIRELETRIIAEVSSCLRTKAVAIVEIDENKTVHRRAGQAALPTALKRELIANQANLQVNTVYRAPQGWFVKLGSWLGRDTYLSIHDEVDCLQLRPKRVWLRTLSRYVSLFYDHFLVTENLEMELHHLASRKKLPTWLLRMMFALLEKERKRLGLDLHDSALQELIVNVRLLDTVLTEMGPNSPWEGPLRAMMEGLLDVISQIRLTCNELCPPLLQELGLVASLQTLVETVQLQNDYVIEFTANGRTDWTDEVSLAIYRIVQELFANATKHSNASYVKLSLETVEENVHLRYEDNGIGMDMSQLKESYQSMGIYGIRERVRSLGGTIRFELKKGRGVRIRISLPKITAPDDRSIDWR